ncbi:Protein kinase-like domain containing protein [Elaphomyces granulatus]
MEFSGSDTSQSVVAGKDQYLSWHNREFSRDLFTRRSNNIVYRPIDDVESINMYRPGGYHPITIGDHLHDRYQIMHKLGFGPRSTIWLAWDNSAGRYVAIKIPIAEAHSQESIVLHQLSANQLQALFPPIFDEFFVTGPNGKHQCLVTPLAGASLADIQDAVCSLHSEGIVHACLHPGNILLQLPKKKNLDSISPDKFYEEFGEPIREPVERKPLPLPNGTNGLPHNGVPECGIRPLYFGETPDPLPLSHTRIILAGFGGSFFPPRDLRCSSLLPPNFYPPEFYFLPEESLSFPADIWALGCVIWRIMGYGPLFYSYSSVEWMIDQYTDLLGGVPLEWSWKYPALERFEIDMQESRRTLGMEQVGEEEKADFFDMLKAMMVYKPEARMTAEEVRQSEWMTKWAMPELLIANAFKWPAKIDMLTLSF